MSASNKLTSQDVAKIAQLASLTVSDEEKTLFADQFGKTIAVIDELNEVDTSGVLPTSSVAGLTNITHPDEIDPTRQLTQVQALSGAKKTHHGFFVISQILTKE